ncbi:MAG: hypothetical protein AAF183_13320 [Pseudomonadota bacterium]
MKRFAGLISAALVLGLGGCESFRLFNDYQAVESPEVETAEWPRLVDVPEAPPPGTYSAEVPDPVVGVAVDSELSAAAAEADAQRARASQPVLSETERDDLAERAKQSTERAKARRN